MSTQGEGGMSVLDALAEDVRQEEAQHDAEKALADRVLQLLRESGSMTFDALRTAIGDEAPATLRDALARLLYRGAIDLDEARHELKAVA